MVQRNNYTQYDGNYDEYNGCYFGNLMVIIYKVTLSNKTDLVILIGFEGIN